MATTAFDAHAETYDSVATSALGRVLRDRVHRAMSDVTAPGDQVVDLGCGTGIDAAWLAPQVASVLAFDASDAMVAHARKRCASLSNVTVAQSDAAEVVLDHPVDVVLANFGVVNCLGDLGSFAQRLQAMLVAGGYAVLVTMGRWCPIELAIAIATRNKRLFNRRSPQARLQIDSSTEDTDYGQLSLRYASVQQLVKAFGDQFELTRAESLGLTLPPFEQRHWVEGRHRLLAALADVDRKVGWLGARAGLGDHHITVFRMRS